MYFKKKNKRNEILYVVFNNFIIDVHVLDIYNKL